jgi:hypothetical protein
MDMGAVSRMQVVVCCERVSHLSLCTPERQISAYQRSLCDVSQQVPSLLLPDWHEHLAAMEYEHMHLLRFQLTKPSRPKAAGFVPPFDS